MWLLTCSGDLFGGKKLWLRPGSTHLLGRTSGRSEAGERIQYIDHKTVSRKHLIIRVGEVRPGDSAHIHTRSTVTFTDGSKIGTTINGEKILQDSKTLVGKQFIITLGSYVHEFQLRWEPCVVSFTALGKKAKASDALSAHRASLESADIKLVAEYVTNQTTHAVAKKRNTPAALQALVQGRWLVTDAFVGALTAAVSNEQDESLLERGFRANWPAERDFIVPAGGEPVPRSNELVSPNPERAEVFHGFTFLFLAQGQYDVLFPVVAAGGGKALMWEVVVGQSRPEDLVEYVKQIAGHKGSGQFALDQQLERGGVVLVRLNGGEEGWREFLRSVDSQLDQRSIEQNEFLDAILMNDASGLKRQLKHSEHSLGPDSNVEASVASVPIEPQEMQQRQQVITVSESQPLGEEPLGEPQTHQTLNGPPLTQPQQQEEQALEPPSAAARRRARRVVTKSRFQGFDDFDPSQILRAARESPESSNGSREPSQAPSEQEMDTDGPSHQTSTRKRPPPIPEETEADMYENMLTGVAAMKRRKTEAVLNKEKNTFANSFDESNQPVDGKPRKKSKEMDVMAEVQKRRKAEEEQRQKDEEALREGLTGINISDLKNLAKIEEMEIPLRQPPPPKSGEQGPSSRWDPAWNGRRNFKKFRPQGQRRDAPRLPRVMVTLEEVPRKGHGIGDEYWLQPVSGKSKSKSQSQSQTLRHSENGEADSERFRRRIQASHEDDAARAVDEEVLPEEIAGHPRNEELLRSPVQASSHKQASAKRPAATAQLRQGGGRAAKQAKASHNSSSASASSRVPKEVISLDDDEEDELKFRRRRK